MAQAVNHRLPVAAAQVLSQVKSCEVSGGRSGTGAGFLRVLLFLVPVLIPPTAAHSLIALSSTLYSIDVEIAVKHPI
jgi:hypothetical protein